VREPQIHTELSELFLVAMYHLCKDTLLEFRGPWEVCSRCQP